MEVALGWPLGYPEPDGSGIKGPCWELSSPLIQPSDFRSVIPLNLYSGLLNLRVSFRFRPLSPSTIRRFWNFLSTNYLGGRDSLDLPYRFKRMGAARGVFETREVADL
ncbi:hypothetical protein U1Q18_009573 [Sarracenia purpurea var. burkii]